MNVSIAERLKAWRKHLGLTQEEFSAIAGLHIGVLRKYEGGVNVPGGDALIAIARTGVSIDWLLLGTGNMDAGNKLRDDFHVRIKSITEAIECMDSTLRDEVFDEIFVCITRAKRLHTLETALKELLDAHRADG